MNKIILYKIGFLDSEFQGFKQKNDKEGDLLKLTIWNSLEELWKNN